MKELAQKLNTRDLKRYQRAYAKLRTVEDKHPDMDAKEVEEVYYRWYRLNAELVDRYEIDLEREPQLIPISGAILYKD